VAFNTGKVGEIPVRKKAGQKKMRYFNYAVIRSGRKIVMKKRQEKDIWQNLYEFPMRENSNMKDNFEIGDLLGHVKKKDSYYFKKKSEWKTHLLSHQKIHARFYEFEVDGIKDLSKNDWEVLDIDDVNNYPLPKLIESYMNGL
jgi:A/G-specific adenine glycosylase